jgi:hypothetical protein
MIADSTWVPGLVALLLGLGAGVWAALRLARRAGAETPTASAADFEERASHAIQLLRDL